MLEEPGAGNPTTRAGSIAWTSASQNCVATRLTTTARQTPQTQPMMRPATIAAAEVMAALSTDDKTSVEIDNPPPPTRAAIG